jgi:thiamine-monophosphate kinase
MNELELIRRLTALLPANDSVVAGAGDDCAVLDLGIPGRLVLFKTDSVVEGVHFNADTPPEQIGHKALGRCLSDLAAMGGTPVSALITLALPRDFEVERVEGVYRGMAALARRHEVALPGGETTTNPDRLLLSIAALGTVAHDKCIRRGGALAGDAIFVTGRLGGSLAGRHLEFEPRLAEGRWLAGHFAIHAMIDVSDGLASDLRHLMEAASVGAELMKSSIPISRAARLQAKKESSAKPPLLAALTDGEDFELLFTVSSRDAVPLLDGWKTRFPEVPLTCIGRITSEPGLKLRDQHGSQTFTGHGYIHCSSRCRNA